MLLRAKEKDIVMDLYGDPWKYKAVIDARYA
jgi:hypothetical protein